MKKIWLALITVLIVLAALGWYRTQYTVSPTASTPDATTSTATSTPDKKITTLTIVTLAANKSGATVDAATIPAIELYLAERFPQIQINIIPGTVVIPDALFVNERLNLNDFFTAFKEQTSLPNESIAVLALTPDDMFAPKTDFTFSSVDGHYGILSMNRVTDPDTTLVTKRVGKLVLRMVGSMVGLTSRRTGDQNCVMLFTNTLEDLDSKGFDWCDKEQSVIDRMYAK